LDARDTSFHNNIVDLEVHDKQHLIRIIAALRAAETVVQAERI
jgi:GTP diphosphokinase / guanosine-3',5'-bis(diphosphate) 3'-diphosphatase